MALREIRVDGLLWTVWDVWPQGAAGKPVSEHLRGGWLAMQRGEEKRRIFPTPEGWEDWTDEELASAVRGAAQVQVRA